MERSRVVQARVIESQADDGSLQPVLADIPRAVKPCEHCLAMLKQFELSSRRACPSLRVEVDDEPLCITLTHHADPVARMPNRVANRQGPFP
jgi:hypothetical protein